MPHNHYRYLLCFLFLWGFFFFLILLHIHIKRNQAGVKKNMMFGLVAMPVCSSTELRHAALLTWSVHVLMFCFFKMKLEAIPTSTHFLVVAWFVCVYFSIVYNETCSCLIFPPFLKTSYSLHVSLYMFIYLNLWLTGWNKIRVFRQRSCLAT